MKNIILGIRDYIKDCCHDWRFHCIEKDYDYKLYYEDPDIDYWIPLVDWKEGSVWYYIKQRKLSRRK